MITFITGGVRSGKSHYAQQYAKRLSGSPVYVATARRLGNDASFDERIRRHQAGRGEEWRTYEEEKYVHALPLEGEVVVIDCVTLWLTNFFLDHDENVEAALAEFKKEIDHLASLGSEIIIISNEIGMGLHAETPMGRRFTDLQGWANQYVAGRAARAFFMVSGIPLSLKS
jgi:adenosylcobinamide kinase/adenosylcobinamide-phosphate guanylyltransferase